MDMKEMLRKAGYRATVGRVRLLEFLQKAGRPLSIRAILDLSKGRRLDQATLYRALESFAHAGLVSRVDLNSGIVQYEFAPDKEHHHHLVCTECEKVEDVFGCDQAAFTNRALKRSKEFAQVDAHSFELFGVCRACVSK